VGVAVIGSGMAGMAALDALIAADEPARAYEAGPTWGGHTRSDVVDGFTFDEGPHVSFTSDERVRDVFSRGAEHVLEFETSISNAFRGRWIPHPAQCHLFGLDTDLVVRCIADLAKARYGAPSEARTYADWCRAAFGSSFAETFPFAYTRKYWTVAASELGTDWIGKRVYIPAIEDVVRGALAPDNEGRFHYLSTARYPDHGGFQSFMRAIARPEHVECGKRVLEVDPWNRLLRFADGTEAGYEALISTMPLPELVRSIDARRVPEEVRVAAGALLCTSVALVDIAVDRSDLSAHHWFYSYDEGVSFSRVSFPHNLSPNNAPEGKGSIQAEVYYSARRPLPCDAALLPDRVVEELVSIGVLRSSSEVLWARCREVPFANVVFDHSRRDALSTIRPWIEAQGIVLAGRYGEWGYHWTDDAVRSGWQAVAAVLGEGRGARVTPA
jgi:protoporphyrinogen oxidase